MTAGKRWFFYLINPKTNPLIPSSHIFHTNSFRVKDEYPRRSDGSFRHLSAAICSMTVDVVHGVRVEISDIEGATYAEWFLFAVTLEKHVRS